MARATQFLGRSVSEAAGFGAGLAIGPALHPVVQELVNRSWALHPDRPLSAGEAARIVAEAVELTPWGVTEASLTGISEARFTALLGEVLEAPGLGELYALLRRGLIDAAGFTHGLRKAKMETRWDADLEKLRWLRLTPQQVALGIVRSVITDPGLLVAQLDTSGSNVPQYTPLALDALEEAAAAGIDSERLRGMVGEIGLPMSAQQAASAFFRRIITRGAFNQAILEGDTRPEWAPFILEQARQIPSAHDFIEKRLRGWTDEAGMLAGVRRHGMSDDDAETLFQISGRPPSWHQIWIGLQRGGVYDGPLDAIDPAFLKGLRESNIRPEWYDLLWHSRYTYPSAFVLRALVQDGTLSAAQGEADLLDMGWRPDRAKQAAEHWAGAGGAATDPHVAKAQTQLWNTTHRSFIAGEIHADTATPALAAAGVAAGAIDDVLTLWRQERALRRKQLTPAQIKKAFTHSAINEATGVAWTRDEAIAALIALGYAPETAGDFLNL